jgi:hypothetical protein
MLGQVATDDVVAEGVSGPTRQRASAEEPLRVAVVARVQQRTGAEPGGLFLRLRERVIPGCGGVSGKTS